MDVSGQTLVPTLIVQEPVGPIFSVQEGSRHLKMGPAGCSGTSVSNYHYSLLNKDRREQFSATSRCKPDITHNLFEYGSARSNLRDHI